MTDLSDWFAIPVVKCVSGRFDEPHEEALQQIRQATSYAESDDCLLFACPGGRVLVHVIMGMPLGNDGIPIVMTVEYARQGSGQRSRFWVNSKDIKELTDRRTKLPKADFRDLLAESGTPIRSAG